MANKKAHARDQVLSGSIILGEKELFGWMSSTTGETFLKGCSLVYIQIVASELAYDLGKEPKVLRIVSSPIFPDRWMTLQMTCSSSDELSQLKHDELKNT